MYFSKEKKKERKGKIVAFLFLIGALHKSCPPKKRWQDTDLVAPVRVQQVARNHEGTVPSQTRAIQLPHSTYCAEVISICPGGCNFKARCLTPFALDFIFIVLPVF